MMELQVAKDLPVFKLLGLLLVAVCVLWAWLRTRYPPLPPGPPSEFFWGHFRIIPKVKAAETYALWGKEYGSDVIFLKSLGQPIVVLNSVEAARDILDRRGLNYSDRPSFPLLEIMGWKATVSFMPYGPRWMMHRKLLQTTLSNSNVREWHPLETLEARRTARDIAMCPEDWHCALQRFAVSVVMKVSYGIDVHTKDDPHMKLAKDAVHAMSNGGSPVNSIVDVFPTARYLPDWLVRDWPLKFARGCAPAIKKVHDVTFEKAQRDAAEGRSNSSLAHTLLKKSASKPGRSEALAGPSWKMEDIRGVAGAMIVAGSDTTWATLTVLILNLLLHPEIQEKAQKILDEVVGPDRLPEYSDRPALKYIDYIAQEAYRWSPLSPLGIPHKSIKEDIYRGMLIPKGISIVFANALAMAHDERIHEAPLEFNPDRYLPIAEGGLGEPYPTGPFGFGRRVCVGRFLGDNSVWMVAATVLATLKIEKQIKNGVKVEPRVEFTNGGTCHPLPFACSFRPRSEQAIRLLDQALVKSQDNKRDQ